jgi:hypothetical protein
MSSAALQAGTTRTATLTHWPTRRKPAGRRGRSSKATPASGHGSRTDQSSKHRCRPPVTTSEAVTTGYLTTAAPAEALPPALVDGEDDALVDVAAFQLAVCLGGLLHGHGFVRAQAEPPIGQ